MSLDQSEKATNPKYEYETWGHLTGEKLKSQNDVKPKVEDVAGEFISKDKLENLLNFLEYLQKIKLTPRWASGNSWTVKSKGKTVCFIKIVGPSWFVMYPAFTREKWFAGYDAYFADELKDFVWACNSGSWCPRACKGKKRIILGREIEDICGCWGIRAKNPDGAVLEHSKAVILAIKSFISDLPAENRAK